MTGGWIKYNDFKFGWTTLLICMKYSEFGDMHQWPTAYDWFLKTRVHHLLLYRLNWCLSTSTIKTEVRSRSRKPHGDRECLWSSRILDHGLIVVTDELGLPAEAWRVEPNTSWQRCWLAIQDGPLSRGNGGRVLKITVISNQRLFRQGQSERGNSNLALSYSPRQSHFAL